MYHVDRKLEIPPKLEAWATTKAMAYLAIHAPGVLILNTWKKTWAELRKENFHVSEWTKVEGKSRNKKQKSKSKNTKKQPVSVIPTIDEESDEDVEMIGSPTDTVGASDKLTATDKNEEVHEMTSSPTKPAEASETLAAAANNINEDDQAMTRSSTTPVEASEKLAESDNVSNTSSTGKQSVLIPTLNVPMNDGTHRITIRWKTTIDVHKVSSQSSQMNLEIHNLLKELFSDEDGHIYQWGTPGIDTFNQISKLSPAEVRSFICPSIQIIPNQSLVIIPLRFGFTEPSPAT